MQETAWGEGWEQRGQGAEGGHRASTAFLRFKGPVLAEDAPCQLYARLPFTSAPEGMVCSTGLADTRA